MLKSFPQSWWDRYIGVTAPNGLDQVAAGAYGLGVLWSPEGTRPFDLPNTFPVDLSDLGQVTGAVRGEPYSPDTGPERGFLTGVDEPGPAPTTTTVTAPPAHSSDAPANPDPVTPRFTGSPSRAESTRDRAPPPLGFRPCRLGDTSPYGDSEESNALPTQWRGAPVESNIRLFRFRGIEVGANWSLLVIAWLITWGLAGTVLPQAVPGRPAVAYWATGLIAAAIFLASLVAHEMGHALVARRRGVRVEHITLWLFGGMTELKSDDPDPATELRVGVVGPMVSLAIGVVAGLAAAAAGLVDTLELQAAALWWLSWINVLLAGFNLLPAFPLDGGRVLRAALWQRWDDRVRATVAAAKVGEMFAYGLMFLGFLAFAGGAWLSGIWFVFLGWFLFLAARAETTVVTQHDTLAGVTVGDLMTRDPVVAPAHASVAELIDDYLFRFRHSAYPVVDDLGRPVGLVTLERIRTVPPALRSSTDLRSIAFPMSEVPCRQTHDDALPLVGELATSRPGRALVFEGTNLVGIVSRTDIVRILDLRTSLGPAHTGERPAFAGSGTEPGG